MENITVTITQEITEEQINDLVCTALEGGITYWCGKARAKVFKYVDTPDKDQEKVKYIGVLDEDQEKINFASDVIGYGGTLIFYDAESSDKWELTIEKMLKGIQRQCTEKKCSVNELLDGYDAEDADCIIQYALFDEIIFG